MKNTAERLAKDVTTPLSFARGDYKLARRHFAVLAALFAVIGEYDGDVRWKEPAPELRDRFARAAEHCKVGTVEAFNEAKQRRDDLNDIVRGNAVIAAKPAGRKADWPVVVDRSRLMQRNQQAYHDTLDPDTAGDAKFNESKDKIIREATLVAAIATIVMQPGMPNADEGDYRKHAEQLRDSARAVVEAAKLGHRERARAAFDNMSKSCSNCHVDFR